MKKIISIFLTLALMFSISIPVFANSEVPAMAYVEEALGEYENEPAYSFDPTIAQAMARTDSFIDKVANTSMFDVSAGSAILIETTTGQVLYEKNPDSKVAIASVTKIMTMLLVIEALEAGEFTLDDTVPISNHAFSMGGSQIWAEPGEIFTVNEMLKAVAVSSANDAAVALAEFVSGSEEEFCRKMNARAKELGMENTNFVNACGLDAENHYSTARDVSLMANELIKHQMIFDYTTIWVDYLRDGQTQIVNTNKLLQSYQGITGLKTGTTSGAGVCLTASAQRDGLSIISVILGSDSSEERFSASKKLLDFGFANFETKAFPEITDVPSELKTKNSVIENAKIEYNIPDSLLFLKDSSTQLSYEVELMDYIQAPMKKDMRIGSISLYTQNGKIGEYDITLSEDVEKIDFSKALSLLTKYAGYM